jgi:DNA (cytosine-5)-methyltransferase 1
LKVESSHGIKAVSMFSGAGGLDIGTQLAGVPVLTSLDIFEDSVRTIQQNAYFKNTMHECGDITKIDGSHYSDILRRENPEKLIIVGGPPCQPFSKAGYWVTNEKRNSSEDPRNMIKPYFKIIAELQPDGFVLENVESIMHPSNHEAVETIYENMERLGYKCSVLKINAAEYGIPQKRKRVFFLASKKEIKAELKQTHGSDKECAANPELLPYERVVDWIGKFDDPIYFGDEKLSAEGKWEHELTCVPFGKNYIALTERAGYPDPVFVAGKRYWLSLLKLHPFLPSWTVIASPGHWEGPFHWKSRRLSIRELAAIQTFPDDYQFYGSVYSQHKQIGNAVPPLLGKKVVEELCRWI